MIPVTIIPKHDVVLVPQNPGRYLFTTSFGDSTGPLVRAGGTALKLSLTGVATAQVDLQFGETIEFHDAGFFWGSNNSFDRTDELSFMLVAPATVVVADAGAGDCNLSAVTGGNKLIPASLTDGSHDVNLTNAVPVLAEDNSGNPNGNWNVDWDDGVITPIADIATPDGNVDLFDFEIIPRMAAKILMTNADKEFHMAAYKVLNVHPNHKLRLKITKNSTGLGWVVGWMRIFRNITT